MISQEMEKALNEQINRELYSSYLYLSMATFLAEKNFDGMAQFMKVQAKEEVEHAMKIYHYIEEQGGRVLLKGIDEPPSDFTDPLTIFEKSLEHEKFVTKSIHDLVSLAVDKKDYATKTFLDWFVSEQVEEEATMDGIVNKLKMIGDKGHALLMIDAQLGKREDD